MNHTAASSNCRWDIALYRQEGIFGRAGLAIPRSTLAAWVGQCGVQLQPLVVARQSGCKARDNLDENRVAAKR